MLLIIHNLPSNIRYADVKSLIHEKCGLNEIILDNLVSEGKGKKVTVGLANEDDGALVVRKLNGLYLNGQQLYIEDRRRKTDVYNQPYHTSASLIQESRCSEPTHQNNMMGGVAAPVAVAWNYVAAAPFMAQMPVDQNLAYPSYGGAPQAMQYMEPQPLVPAANERKYSGFQGEGYSPGNEPRDRDLVAWDRSGREQASDSYRHQDRKRRHSPEKPAAAKKKASRWAEEAPRRREASPPRQQWPQERNEGPRMPLRQPEQFARNQNQYQPRQPKPDNQRTDPQWEARPRRDDSNPRSERQREWDTENNRDWEPRTDKVWNDQPNQQWRDEPRRWDYEPNPQWDDQRNPQWEEDLRMREEEIRSEWHDRYPAEGNPPDDFPPRQRIHERDFGREFEPRQRDADFDGRHQNDRSAPNKWSRDATPGNLVVSRSDGSSSRHVRREDELQRRDRPMPNNARQGRDRREDRPRSPRDRSGDERENPDYWRQVANDYAVSKRPEFVRRDAPNASRHDVYNAPKNDAYNAPRNDAYNAPRNDRKPTYKQDTFKKPITKEAKKYPPKEDRHFPPQRPVEPRFDNTITKKPQTLTSMINKDHSNRGQATASIAKKIIGLPTGSSTYIPGSALDGFVFKQLKLCIRSRIDVLLGEELSSDMDEVIKRYRLKFPASGDRSLMKQIREKSTKEYKEKQEKLAIEREQAKEATRRAVCLCREKKHVESTTSVGVKDQIVVKKESADKTQNNSQDKAEPPEEASSEHPNEATIEPQSKAVTGEIAKINPGPSFPKLPKAKPQKPLTDKQIIQQMKLQRKWEYDQDDLYNLDPVSDKALDDEMAELDTLFNEECAKTDDPQEDIISKLISTKSVDEFNKTIRLYITKRFLNIPTGLAVRIFGTGKLPKRTAIKQYLKSYRIERLVLKKSVKGTMYVINLSRFQDFDNLCRIEHDVIDGIPVTFKAMHLTGPPPKITKNQVKQMRQKLIQGQIEGNPGDFIDTGNFTEDVNIASFNEDELEDF